MTPFMAKPGSNTATSNSSDIMKATAPSEDDDEVGYGKPPKKNQFKKGKSGNPKGRPKKKKSRTELFDEVWHDDITVNGKKMTRVQAFVVSLVTDGIKGKASARNLLIGMLPSDVEELEEFDPEFDDKIEWMKTMRRLEERKVETEENEE